jgi:hypothetical protein
MWITWPAVTANSLSNTKASAAAPSADLRGRAAAGRRAAAAAAGSARAGEADADQGSAYRDRPRVAGPHNAVGEVGATEADHAGAPRRVRLVSRQVGAGGPGDLHTDLVLAGLPLLIGGKALDGAAGSLLVDLCLGKQGL